MPGSGPLFQALPGKPWQSEGEAAPSSRRGWKSVWQQQHRDFLVLPTRPIVAEKLWSQLLPARGCGGKAGVDIAGGGHWDTIESC